MHLSNNRLRAAVCVLAVLFASSGVARTPIQPSAAQPTNESDDCHPSAVSITHHSIPLAGHPFAYMVRTGLLPIRDTATGETHGCMFFVAYVHPSSAPRPLTFVWNGGPGSNSTWLHLEAYGPMRIAGPPRPTEPWPKPLRLEPNPETLLDQSDLVFVDPIGTGFSRPTKLEYGPEFYNVLGDIASVAEFIRVYRTRFEAQPRSLLLLGESYGVWRAAGVAEALERAGTPVAGAILLSGGIPVGPVMTPAIKVAFEIPNRTAAAFYWHKLAPDLQTDFQHAIDDSEAWSSGEYAPALAQPASLSPEQRASVVTQLARFTGVRQSQIDASTLIVRRRDFVKQLLADQNNVLESLDARLVTLEPVQPERIALIESYLRRDLKFDDDLAYVGLGNDGYVPSTDSARKSVNEGWNYNQMQGAPTPPPTDKNPTVQTAFAESHDGPGEHQPWLKRAMQLDPGLKVFVGAGWFDTWNSCFGNRYIVTHVSEAMQRNMIAHCYRSGHIIYRDHEGRKQLRDDLRRFYDHME